jgi:hypothetical protein
VSILKQAIVGGEQTDQPTVTRTAGNRRRGVNADPYRPRRSCTPSGDFLISDEVASLMDDQYLALSDA